jgi:hypothetical protein
MTDPNALDSKIVREVSLERVDAEECLVFRSRVSDKWDIIRCIV